MAVKRLRGTSFCDSKHVYTWAETPGSPTKRQFVSVTTVLGVLNKPALPRWAARSVGEYVAELAEQCRSGKLKGSELLARLTDIDHLKGVPWAYSEKRKCEGTAFHDIAERIIDAREAEAAGEPFEEINPDVFDPKIGAKVRAFMDWLDEAQPHYEAMEAAVFSRQYGYAGTLDAIVTIGGRRIVLDYKDSKDTYPEHALQLSAYRHAEFMAMSDGTETPMPSTAGGAILLIREDGCKLCEWSCGRAMFDVFLSLLPVAQWTKQRLTPVDMHVGTGRF